MLLQESHVPLSMSVQQKFIAFAGYLHHKGLATLVGDVYKAVETVLRGYALVDFGLFEYILVLFFLQASNTEVASKQMFYKVIKSFLA